MNLELKLNDAPGLARPAIDIRYGQVGLVQLRIRTTDPGAILDELTGRVATAPHFFQRTAVYLDLGAIQTPPDAGEVRAVIDAVRRAGMLTVALAAGSPGVETLAKTLDMPLLSGFRSAGTAPAAVPRPMPFLAASAVQPAAEAAAPESPRTGVNQALIHGQTVRSGQRLYARGRDLIITATVGAGAEVMADGCVHVYGPLRGRVMAGVRGETAARVFCQEFCAELVSVAGVFRVFETIPADLAGKPVQAWLEGEDLRFAPIRN